jgi:hypothetical protein
MNGRRTTWLAGLLIVQLLAATAVVISRGGFREPESGPLLAFDAAAIDRIRIEESADEATGDRSEKAIELQRGDAGWRLGDGVPADGAKVEGLLEKLAGLEAPWPVATTAAARERFEVTDEKRQRLVRLQTGDRTAAELLLGTSPGFRRLHVRIPGAGEIYEVDLTHFELSTNVDEWVDRALLAADGEVSAVAREGRWRLARSDDGWMLDDGAADPAAAEQMAERFANLRVLGAAPLSGQDGEESVTASAEATATESKEHEPVAVFVVTDAKGAQRLTVYSIPDATEYAVVSDRQPGRYRLAAFVAEQLLLESSALLPGAGEAAAAVQDGAAGATADGATGVDAPGRGDQPGVEQPAAEQDVAVPAH